MPVFPAGVTKWRYRETTAAKYNFSVPHLHVANGDAVVDAVSDHLVLHLLPPPKRLLHQDLRAEREKVTERGAGRRRERLAGRLSVDRQSCARGVVSPLGVPRSALQGAAHNPPGNCIYFWST